MNRVEKRRQRKLAKNVNLAHSASPFSGQQTLTIQQSLELAVRHHNAGRLPEAKSIYQQILLAAPDQPIALHLLGVIAHQGGKNEIAVNFISKALSIKPDYAEAYSNLGLAFQDLNKLDDAVASYNMALAIKPIFAEAHSNRGNALQGLGKLEGAVDSYIKALAIKPDYAEAHFNLGNALHSLGKLEEAVASYNKALAIKPDYAESYSNLCEIYEKNNMAAELKKTLHQAQEALPRDNPHLLYRMAQFASSEKRLEDTRSFLELIDPENLPLKIRPGHSELLAKTYDKLGQFSNAFTQFEITNEMTKKASEAIQFSGHHYYRNVSQLSKSWSNLAKIRWPVKQESATQHSLAFLVGFPRSGTTLLDSILRSHPEVSVIEEKPMVEAMLAHIGKLPTADFVTSLNDDQIADLRKVYFEELYSHVNSDSLLKHIIDKLPLNIKDVGLIHRVFPNSKFILTLRHPYDCVLSCFMQSFKLNNAMANFLTLQQSAKLYNAIMTLWMHYTRTLDLEVGTLKYEDLVQDLQGTVEPLLSFLGLDWHDNLLNYQQTALSRGEISTPSYSQVTQNLYKQAIGRWKNYQEQMEGALPLLEPWVKRFGY